MLVKEFASRHKGVSNVSMKAELDPKTLILSLEVDGEFGNAEVESVEASVQEHAREAALAGVMLDLRTASLVTAESESIRSAARRAQDFEATHGLRMAVIAESDFAFGLSRMYELVRDEDDNVRVFREIGPALEWLGLDAPAT